jgi:hypothetical protein
VADIGRHEEAIWIGLDEVDLIAGRCLAPDPGAIVLVLDVHRIDLVSHPEGRQLPGLALLRLGECEADLAQPVERGFAAFLSLRQDRPRLARLKE